MRERRSPSWKRFGDMARDSGRMTTSAAAFKLDPLPGVPREVQVSFLLWLTAVAAGVVETIIRAIDSLSSSGGEADVTGEHRPGPGGFPTRSCEPSSTRHGAGQEKSRMQREEYGGGAWLAVVAGNARARRFYERRGWSDGGPFEYAAAGDHGPIPVPSHRYVKDL